LYTIIAFTVLVLFVVALLMRKYKEKIRFFSTGLDSKFSVGEISLLWKLANICDLESPIALYWSVPALTRSIAHVLAESHRKGTENTNRIQNFLTKLYKYRTKIELEADRRKGLDSTRELSEGQRLRIILPGSGVFTSEIKNNARELTIKLPVRKGVVKVQGERWVGHIVNVYLWRKGDAGYVFDSKVNGFGVFRGSPVLYLAQTEKLLRTQKRKSVRAACNVYAQMFIIRTKDVDYNLIETAPGYKCLIEDISESGAMVRVGGKGVPNIRIKLQFSLNDTFIVMFGNIKAVEYNAAINQSRLHFECTHIDKAMKNIVLSFVYDVLPQKDKEIFDALSQTEADALEDQPSNHKEVSLQEYEENPVITVAQNNEGIDISSADNVSKKTKASDGSAYSMAETDQLAAELVSLDDDTYTFPDDKELLHEDEKASSDK
jgi:c-di-GMP-binding flagellar brake protein YcgR